MQAATVTPVAPICTGPPTAPPQVPQHHIPQFSHSSLPSLHPAIFPYDWSYLKLLPVPPMACQPNPALFQQLLPHYQSQLQHFLMKQHSHTPSPPSSSIHHQVPQVRAYYPHPMCYHTIPIYPQSTCSAPHYQRYYHKVSRPTICHIKEEDTSCEVNTIVHADNTPSHSTHTPSAPTSFDTNVFLSFGEEAH